MSFILLGFSSAPLATVAEIVNSFTQKHCMECHEAETKKGGVDLSSLKPDLSDAQTFARWVQVHDRVASREIPPQKKATPPGAERDAFVDSLREQLHEVSLAQQRAQGRVVVHRLNLAEYDAEKFGAGTVSELGTSA
jgi:hypothetical protein